MTPDQIRNLHFVIPNVDQLDLDESGLTGTIPSDLGQLTKLGKSQNNTRPCLSCPKGLPFSINSSVSHVILTLSIFQQIRVNITRVSLFDA
jgi:hypothetical protein